MICITFFALKICVHLGAAVWNLQVLLCNFLPVLREDGACKQLTIFFGIGLCSVCRAGSGAESLTNSFQKCKPQQSVPASSDGLERFLVVVTNATAIVLIIFMVSCSTKLGYKHFATLAEPNNIFVLSLPLSGITEVGLKAGPQNDQKAGPRNQEICDSSEVEQTWETTQSFTLQMVFSFRDKVQDERTAILPGDTGREETRFGAALSLLLTDRQGLDTAEQQANPEIHGCVPVLITCLTPLVSDEQIYSPDANKAANEWKTRQFALRVNRISDSSQSWDLCTPSFREWNKLDTRRGKGTCLN